MILEHLSLVSLYLICITTGMIGGIATFFHRNEEETIISTIQLIGICFLAFTISIVLGSTFFELDAKSIMAFSYFVLTFGILVMYKRKIKSHNLLVLVVTLSISLMVLPISKLNEFFNLLPDGFFNIINIFSLFPIIFSLIIINKVRHDNLSNDFKSIISIILLGVIAIVVIPSDYSAIISAVFIILPTVFIVSLMKIESDHVLENIRSKLSALETEFNYELRRELNKRTFHLKEVQEKMSHINKIDNLTKAYNKNAILNIMDDLISDRKIEYFSVIMFDLDNFKTLNDTLGHVKGDLCLRSLSSIAFESIRDSDFFGRYGGDEFLIVLPNANLQTALTISERFRTSVFTKTQPYFTVSVGLASYPADGKNVKAILGIADKGLYLSKEKGRNSVSYHNPDLDKKF